MEDTNNDSKVRIVIPEPRYLLIDAIRQELPDIVWVNASLWRFEHKEIFPWHLVIFLEARDLDNNGMPTPAENEILFEIGDTIEEALLTRPAEHGGPNVLFLSRSTWSGQRELDYYVHDPDAANDILEELLGTLNQRAWEYRLKHDPEWEGAGPIFSMLERMNFEDSTQSSD